MKNKLNNYGKRSELLEYNNILNSVDTSACSSKAEEQIRFAKIDSKEDEFLLMLSENEKLFKDALKIMIGKVRGESTEDTDKLINKMINWESHDNKNFLKLSRSSAVVRSMQGMIYDNIMLFDDGSEYFKNLKNKKRELVFLRNKFAESNVRLVISLANKYVHRSSNFSVIEDMVQEGMMGLMKAIEKFESGREFRFSTYASWWIKQNMNRYTAEKVKQIRFPVHLSDHMSRVNQTIAKYEIVNGTKPTKEKISELTGLSTEVVEKIMLASMIKVHSLDKPCCDNDDQSPSLVEMISSEDDISPFDDLTKKYVNKTITESLKSLTQKESFILEKRFIDNMTLHEIGEMINVTRERVRQIEARALSKLKKNNNLRNLH